MFCGEVCGKMFLFLGVGKEITRYPSNIHYGWINWDFTWWGQGVISHTFAKFVPLLCVWILLIRRSGCWFYVMVGDELKEYWWWDTKLSVCWVGRCKRQYRFLTLCRSPPTVLTLYCNVKKACVTRRAKSLHHKLEQATRLRSCFPSFSFL